MEPQIFLTQAKLPNVLTVAGGELQRCCAGQEEKQRSRSLGEDRAGTKSQSISQSQTGMALLCPFLDLVSGTVSASLLEKARL